MHFTEIVIFLPNSSLFENQLPAKFGGHGVGQFQEVVYHRKAKRLPETSRPDYHGARVARSFDVGLNKFCCLASSRVEDNRPCKIGVSSDAVENSGTTVEGPRDSAINNVLSTRKIDCFMCEIKSEFLTTPNDILELISIFSIKASHNKTGMIEGKQPNEPRKQRRI